MNNIKRLLPVLAGLALLGFAAPRASAWNGTGHMVTAEIAYDNLTPKAKKGVDALLRNHRDYALWMAEKPPGYPDKARWAFMKASTWPDDVRKTPDDRPSWHYIDLPVVTPGYKPNLAVVPIPNAQTQIVAETALLTSRTASDGDRAVALCWVSHLIGDVHQPLHTSSLFSAQFPRGDRGGNDESLAPGAIDGDPLEAAAHPHKLHALWDDLFGATQDPAEIERIARSIEAENYARGTQVRYSVGRDLPGWIAQTHSLVWPFVYLNGKLPMTPTMPEQAVVALPPGYLAAAHRLARRQIAQAGLRLAGVINSSSD